MIRRCLLILLFSVINGYALAQATVTFNVDMKGLLADSLFVPGEDQLKLTGDIFPLGRGRDMLLKDTAPEDSIYSVEVSFFSRDAGDMLIYNYLIIRPESTEREIQPRQLLIPSGNTELTPIPFNAFVR